MQRLHGCEPFVELYLPLQNPRTHNIDIPKIFTSIKLHHFNHTFPNRTVPNRAFQESIRFGLHTIRSVHCRARALGPRFGSARPRKFRAGRRFGSKMLGTVRYGSRMYSTGSPVWSYAGKEDIIGVTKRGT